MLLFLHNKFDKRSSLVLDKQHPTSLRNEKDRREKTDGQGNHHKFYNSKQCPQIFGHNDAKVT
jgi:hypothetical protein